MYASKVIASNQSSFFNCLEVIQVRATRVSLRESQSDDKRIETGVNKIPLHHFFT